LRVIAPCREHRVVPLPDNTRARGAETGGRIDAGVSELELKVTILRPMDSTQAAKQL
jgi:hypothetical protein